MIPYRQRLLDYKYKTLKNSPETADIIEYGENIYKEQIKALKQEIKALKRENKELRQDIKILSIK